MPCPKTMNNSSFDTLSPEIFNFVYGVDGAFFKLSVALMLIISCLAIGFNMLLIVTLWKTSIIQPHSKILLTNLSLSAVCFSVCQLITNIWAVLTVLNVPNYRVLQRDCSLQSAGKTISTYCLSCSTVFVAWERAVATKNFRSYEKYQKFRSASCVLIAWITPAMPVIFSVLRAPNSFLPICHSFLIYSSLLVFGCLVVDLCLSLLTLSIFLTVNWYNKRKLSFYLMNQAQLNLSERFQLKNNIEITTALIPSVLMHAAIYALTDIAMVYMSYQYEINKEISHTNVLWSQYCNVLITGYTLLHPISMILGNRRLRLLASVMIFRKNVVSTRVHPKPSESPATVFRGNLTEAQNPNDVDQIRLNIITGNPHLISACNTSNSGDPEPSTVPSSNNIDCVTKTSLFVNRWSKV